jgi:hypothetical protein
MMGWMEKLARTLKPAPPAPIQLLEESMSRLRIGIFARLLRKYAPVRGEEEGKFLSAALLNEALTEEPRNDQARKYLARNRSVVAQELMKLRDDAGLAEALSYLYAAQTLYLACATRSPLSERAQALGERATELGIYIPNTYDLCGSGDANACVLAIVEYARRFFSE